MEMGRSRTPERARMMKHEGERRGLELRKTWVQLVFFLML
jgi:hypothetical protein